jgi:hypothetical protein
MTKSCCGSPRATIINVGEFEAGITGLETVFQNVHATGIMDEEQIKSELLRCVKEFGNYISPGTDNIYKEALVREYKKYLENIERLPKSK